MKNKFLFMYSLFIMGFAFSCDFKNGQGDFFEISHSIAQPGETVFISKNEGTFSLDSELEVSIAEKDAPIVGVSPQGLLQVLVPKVKEGTANVSVSENKQNIGSAELRILGSSTEQLLLELNEEGELKLIRKKDDLGGLENQFATGDIQLNYDLVCQNENVIFSGSIAHPQKTGLEIFEDPEGTKIHREVPKQMSVVFPIRIPKLDEAKLVRFYEAESGVDLTTREGREKRVFLSEIKLR